MRLGTYLQNKKTYLSYNNFRKRIFSELAPQDSEIILYMLPWMLSLNDPAVPGYVEGLQEPMAVHGIRTDAQVLKRERIFLRTLKSRKNLSVASTPQQVLPIEGIYTIGSIGTISQTSSSDCDIWICIRRQEFSDAQFQHLVQKTNLIKGWLDNNIRIPVFFFICDVEDVKNASFGSVEGESAGSTQKNTLKEEFYRTTIMIAGKIPLWWLCFDRDEEVDYAGFLAQYRTGAFGDYDGIDLGPLDSVESGEYFGAALWQFNKALTNPLKSILKMLLLEMLLAAPKHDLLCHQFRSFILRQEKDLNLIDPSMFTMEAILKHNQGLESETFDFIKQCLYLRYEFRLLVKLTLKEILAQDVFKRYPIAHSEIEHLNSFNNWPLTEQIHFGQRVFALLAKVYKNISSLDQGVASSVHPQDMNIIGRKLSACLEKKPNKISVFHKPARSLNVPSLTFAIDSQKAWNVFTRGTSSVVSSPDIVYCLTYLIWNGIYQPALVRMTPNATSVTLQEINSLAERIREIFGVHDVSGIDFACYLEPERVTKMLIVVSFEGHSASKDTNDLGVIYRNHWGEVFVHRFSSPAQFGEFVRAGGRKFRRAEIHYYVQRNCLYYEKIIDKTKAVVTQTFAQVLAKG
jgi:adenylate cyclase class 1